MAVEFYRGLSDPGYVVSFVMLTFPMKNSSGLRTNTATEAADFGEVLMLAQLRRLLEFLKALGLPNVRFICLADGLVYSRYLGPYPRLQPIFYRENIRRFRTPSAWPAGSWSWTPPTWSGACPTSTASSCARGSPSTARRTTRRACARSWAR